MKQEKKVNALGATTTWITVLKGHNLRKVEKHCV